LQVPKVHMSVEPAYFRQEQNLWIGPASVCNIWFFIVFKVELFYGSIMSCLKIAQASGVLVRCIWVLGTEL